MSTKKSTSAKSASTKANPITTAPAATFAPPSPTNSGFMKLLMEISSANYNDERDYPEKWEDEDKAVSKCDLGHYGDHFAWGGSQINSDLSQMAQCEAEGDISHDSVNSNDAIFGFTRSTMYWKLRQQFVKDAMKHDSHCFLYAIWRAYNAGRLCPDRLVPRTEAERLLDRVKMTPEEAQVEGMRRSRKEVAKAIESTY